MWSASPVETTSKVSPWSRASWPPAECVFWWARATLATGLAAPVNAGGSPCVVASWIPTWALSAWWLSRKVGACSRTAEFPLERWTLWHVQVTIFRLMSVWWWWFCKAWSAENEKVRTIGSFSKGLRRRNTYTVELSFQMQRDCSGRIHNQFWKKKKIESETWWSFLFSLMSAKSWRLFLSTDICLLIFRETRRVGVECNNGWPDLTNLLDRWERHPRPYRHHDPPSPRAQESKQDSQAVQPEQGGWCAPVRREAPSACEGRWVDCLHEAHIVHFAFVAFTQPRSLAWLKHCPCWRHCHGWGLLGSWGWDHPQKWSRFLPLCRTCLVCRLVFPGHQSNIHSHREIFIVEPETSPSVKKVCLQLSCVISGKKERTKAPKIQRLVTPLVLQRKRHKLALKKRRSAKKRDEAAEYAKLLAQRLKEAKERKLERRRSASQSKSSVSRSDSTSKK